MEKLKSEATKVATAALAEPEAHEQGPVFRRYAEPCFLWEQCPHVRRLPSEGKNATRYHVKNMRSVLERHVLTDRIAKTRISEIKRVNILDFRERLIEKLGYTRTVQRALSALKIVVKEAYFREDVNRDPTAEVERDSHGGDAWREIHADTEEPKARQPGRLRVLLRRRQPPRRHLVTEAV